MFAKELEALVSEVKRAMAPRRPSQGLLLGVACGLGRV